MLSPQGRNSNAKAHLEISLRCSEQTFDSGLFKYMRTVHFEGTLRVNLKRFALRDVHWPLKTKGGILSFKSDVLVSSRQGVDL